MHGHSAAAARNEKEAQTDIGNSGPEASKERRRWLGLYMRTDETPATIHLWMADVLITYALTGTEAQLVHRRGECSILPLRREDAICKSG